MYVITQTDYADNDIDLARANEIVEFVLDGPATLRKPRSLSAATRTVRFREPPSMILSLSSL